ncbi:MAG: chemotaxis protein CheX [Planctomycetaceae bacterium]
MPQFATDQKPDSRLIQAHDIKQMTEDLFCSMLSMSLSDTETSANVSVDNSLQAAIRIDGEWAAQMTVLATRELAEQIACAMFGGEPGDLEEQDVQDALGEVVNIIGGNAKGIVDKDCGLSLPCVGPAMELEPGGLRVSFACEGQPFEVCLTEQQ